MEPNETAGQEPENTRPKIRPAEEDKLRTYIRIFLMPTLVLKSAILYFGLNYSANPGDGYGWGLFITVLLSLLNFAIFLWKAAREPEET